MTGKLQPPSKKIVQRVRALKSRKGRLEHGSFLAEGPKVVGEALAGRIPCRTIVISQSFANRLEEAPPGFALPDRNVFLLPDSDFDRISPTDSPQGVLGEFEIPAAPSLESFPPPQSPVLILDAVQDPGNVGTAVRACAALGGAAVFLTTGCADVWNPKTVRAAAGSTFRMPILPDLVEADAVEWVRRAKAEVWIASAHGEDLHRTPPPVGSVALVFGNESRGPSAAWGRLPSAREIGLVMENGVDSLNVGVTCALFLGLLREKGLQKPVR